MLKRLLSLVLAALIAVPAPALPAQAAPPSIERPVAHAAGDAAPALPRLAQRLGDTIPPLYMLGGDDKIVPVASFNAATDAFPSAALSFSTTSLGYIFDSAGKWTTRPNNLLTYSNTFSNAAWTKASATITTGVLDRNGGTSASTLTATGAFASLYAFATTSSSHNVIQSIWIRRRTGTGKIWMKVASSGAGFEITGQVTSSWTQVSISGAANASSTPNFLQLDTSGDAVDISEAGVSAVTYETSPRTGDQVITTSAAYYGPRIDYDPNTLAVKGLLIEEARTNTALQSATLASDWSNQGVTGSTDGTLWVDGGTAQKRTAQATTGPHTAYTSATVTTTAGSTYSLSWNVKAGNYSKVYLCAGDGTRNAFATFDISGTADISASQASGASHTGISGSGKYLGSGWFRLTLTFTASAGSVADFLEVGIVQNLTGNTTNGFGEISWTAAGTETYYIGQPQYEVGAFPTSFIPTAASSVTRAADVVQFTGAALTALQGSAWSAAVQFSSVASYAGNPSILDTSSNLQTVFMNGNKAAFFPTILNTANGLSVLAAHRIAASATRSGGRSIVSDGGTVATDATAMTSPSNTYLGSNVGVANFLNGHVASFAVYNQRLSDATLQAKSVVGASYAANDNVNPFAPKFAANDNLPVHWRIAL